ncbi:MAG: WG repeat-containing protein [Crocinitomicaceae bacterium]|nr:WG repeat-containing protein [Crocinitomicaceae bacterium]
MRILLISIFFVAVNSLAQEIKPLFPGVGYSLQEENELVAIQELEACWCYPVYKKDTDTVFSLKAITYPLPVKKSGLWGLINKQGVKVGDFNSNEPYLMTDSGKVKLLGFELENYQWKATDKSALSILDSNGTEKTKYYVASVYRGSFIASKDKKFWGMLNSEMKTLVDFNYAPSHHEGEDFHFSDKGYMTLRENKPGGLNGVVNYKGRVLIPFKWRLLSYVVKDEDYIYAMNDYFKRGYINIKGQTTLPFIYDMLPREITDSNQISTEKYTWFADEDLNQIGPKYQAYEQKGKLYFYKLDGKWGIKDINNKTIIPNIYSSIMDGPRIKDDKDFKCYIVVKNGKYGLINLDGSEIIKPAYDCLCGLNYYAPSGYYIEFKKDNVSYKFSKTGELVEKGGKSGGNCFCE